PRSGFGAAASILAFVHRPPQSVLPLLRRRWLHLPGVVHEQPPWSRHDHRVSDAPRGLSAELSRRILATARTNRVPKPPSLSSARERARKRRLAMEAHGGVAGFR